MQKFFVIFILLLTPLYNFHITSSVPAALTLPDSHQLYTDIGLENIVNYKAFEQALIGYNKITTKKKEIVTLIDFTKPSTEERLYVINVKEKRLLFSSYVSHGRNSGENYATSFSNINGSYKSSLGFYVTEHTYQGKNGYSLVLDGLEKGINDRAKDRAIVIHGAPYCNPDNIHGMGRLGRSLGCPALPLSISKTIIDTIKDGSVLYIYADNKAYLKQSVIFSEETFFRKLHNAA